MADEDAKTTKQTRAATSGREGSAVCCLWSSRY